MTRSSESDTMVAIKQGIGSLTTWIPQLPINPKSVPPETSGTYKTVTVNKKYKDGIVPARDTDYYNPAQLYASTGPKGLTPFASPVKEAGILE